jgi:ferredoxin
MQMKVENCGNCVFCLSVCPFEALSQDPETKKVQLDIDKCRLCGICYGACPSNLITVNFYGTEFLGDYVETAMERTGLSNIIVACRGNTLSFEEIKALVEEHKAIYLSIPCLGRITIPFLLDIVEKGIEEALLIPCKEEFCRFKEGSKVLQSRVDNANLMLEDMGFPGDCIDIYRRHDVPIVDKTLCISCGLCVSICPYEAATIVKDEDGHRHSAIDPEKCYLCGQCVASCPQEAITLPGPPEPAQGGD